MGFSLHGLNCSLQCARLGTAHGLWLSASKMEHNIRHWPAHINDNVIPFLAGFGHRRGAGAESIACLLGLLLVWFGLLLFLFCVKLRDFLGFFFFIRCVHHHCCTASLQGQKLKTKRLGDIGCIFFSHVTTRKDTTQYTVAAKTKNSAQQDRLRWLCTVCIMRSKVQSCRDDLCCT